MNGGRVRDYSLYVAVGVAAVAAIFWAATHSNSDGEEIIGKWAGLGLVTIALLVLTIKENMKEAPVLFWVVLAVATTVHVLGWVCVLRAVDTWRAIWWTPIGVGEYVILSEIIGRTARPSRRRGH